MIPKNNGETVVINKSNLSQLIVYLLEFDPHETNQKIDREILSCSIYVYSLFKLKRVQEIEITKRESPDFQVNLDGNLIGIEHVRATHEDYMAVLNEVEKRPIGTVIEPSFFNPDKKLSKVVKNQSIVEPGKPLSGPGEFAHSTEIKWSKYINNSLIQKTKLLNKSLKIFPKNILLIDDETPCMFTNIILARKYLLEEINHTDWSSLKYKFDEINVRRDAKLMVDILNNEIIVDCSKKTIKLANKALDGKLLQIIRIFWGKIRKYLRF